MFRFVLAVCIVSLSATYVRSDETPTEIRDLIIALDDNDPVVVTAAINSLRDFGRHALPARQKLGELLGDPRYFGPAVEALATMGPDAARQAIAAVDSADIPGGMPRGFLESLTASGPDIIPDVMAMKNIDGYARSGAIVRDYLFWFEPEYCIDPALKLMNNSDPKVGEGAINLFAYREFDVSPALPALSTWLKETSDADQRLKIATVMAAIGPSARKYARQLVEVAVANADQKLGVRLGEQIIRLKPDCDIIADMLLRGVQFELLRTWEEMEECREELIPPAKNALQSKSTDERIRVMRLIAHISSRHLSVLSAKELLQILEDDDPEVIKAGLTIAAFSESLPHDSKLTAKFKELVTHPESGIRVMVLKVLTDHFADKPGIQQAVLRGLDDEYKSTHFSTLVKLGQLGVPEQATIDALVDVTRSQDLEMRWVAASTLNKLRITSQPVIDALVDLLDATEMSRWANHVTVVRALADLTESGHLSPDVLTSLIEEYLADASSKPSDVRAIYFSEAISLLHKIEADPIPRVLDLLVYKDSFHNAASLLNYLGMESADQIEIADDKLGQRFKSVVVLNSAIEEVCDEAVPYLVMALSADDPNTRIEAASLLGRIGTRLEVVGPALHKLLDDDDDRVFIAAVRAILPFAPDSKEMMDKTSSRIPDLNERDRSQVIRELAFQKCPLALTLLLEIARSDDSQKAAGAFEGLATMAPDHPEFGRLCAKVLDLPRANQHWVRRIGEIGPPAAAAAPMLIPFLNEQRRYTGPPASSSLAKIGTLAIPYLLDALESPQWRIRMGAAEALGQIRPVELSLVTQLEELAKDPNYRVAKSARDAIRSIRSSVNGEK